MISNSQFFVLSVTPASPYNLQMYKITFSSISVDWANQILCDSGAWVSDLSESMLSSDGSIIYSFFLFGTSSSTKYLYFCGLSVSSGSVATSRSKSSAIISYLYGLTLNGDYIVNSKSSADNNWAQLHLN